MKKLKEIKNMLKVVIQGRYPAVIIEGESGTGKTTMIKKALEGKEYKRISGYATPLEFYHQLHEHKDIDILWLDDVEGLFRNRRSKANLKALLDIDNRQVSYKSTTTRLLVPDEFEVSAKIIVSGNSFPKDKDFKAVIDRCLYYYYKLTYAEKMKLINKIVKEKDDISNEKKNALLEFLESYTDPSTEGFTLRVVEKILAYMNTFPSNWNTHALALFENSEEKRILLELEQEEGLQVAQRVNLFKRKTGKSRRKYFYLKKELGLTKKRANN